MKRLADNLAIKCDEIVDTSENVSIKSIDKK